MVVVGLEQVVQPRKLLIIREVLRERNKVLFAVGLFYLPIVEEYDGVVVKLVPVSVLIVGRLGFVLYHA